MATGCNGSRPGLDAHIYEFRLRAVAVLEGHEADMVLQHQLLVLRMPRPESTSSPNLPSKRRHLLPCARRHPQRWLLCAIL